MDDKGPADNMPVSEAPVSRGIPWKDRFLPISLSLQLGMAVALAVYLQHDRGSAYLTPVALLLVTLLIAAYMLSVAGRATRMRQLALERGEALEALRQSEARLAEAQALSHVGSWELDLIQNRLHWSDEVFRIFEMDPREFGASYEAFLDCIHPGDRDLVSRAHGESVEQRTGYAIDHRLLLAGDRVKWVHGSGKTFYDEKGTPLRTVGMVRDITTHKEAEERQRLAAALFDNTSEGVVVTDAERCILAVNPAFTEITGYAWEEVAGRNPRVLKSGRHDAEYYRAMWTSLDQQGRWNGEIWNRRKDGSLFPAWQNITCVRNGDGSITHYTSVFSDISQIKQSHQQLEFLAHHDPLTRLPNRLLFIDRLEHALAHARRNQTVARLGGDEFTMVLEGLRDEDEAATVARKLLHALERPFHLLGHEVVVKASIGISLHPNDGEDATTLLKHADVAMYKAKEEGRDNFHFYRQEMSERAMNRLLIESGLRSALENSELELYYQPQFDLESNTLVGWEALMRWNHPERGLILPDEFIPMAEETGLIIPMGEWALREACAWSVRSQAMGAPPARISVNVAGPQIERGNLVKTVSSVLEATGLAPGMLELEITENFIMNKPEHALGILQGLRGLGVGLAIDDFGTGFSSLAYLKRLPIDRLKIDRSFISGLPMSCDDTAICNAVISLGRGLRFSIIAEGIENEAQQEFLYFSSCVEGQGFLYSKPMPESECLQWLKDRVDGEGKLNSTGVC